MKTLNKLAIALIAIASLTVAGSAYATSTPITTQQINSSNNTAKGVSATDLLQISSLALSPQNGSGAPARSVGNRSA